MATTKKKPTAAQLAARKLFAQRAKAGTLKKTAKRKPVAKNPAPAKKRATNKLGGDTVYQVQTSKDGKTWSHWSTYLYSDMAKTVAHRLADDKALAGHYIRVESVKVQS